MFRSAQTIYGSIMVVLGPKLNKMLSFCCQYAEKVVLWPKNEQNFDNNE